MTQVFGVASDLLKQYISKIEKLEQEKSDVLVAIRETFADAKSNGLEPKIIRRILKERKMEPSELDEEETLLMMYKRALGMLPELDQ